MSTSTLDLSAVAHDPRWVIVPLTYRDAEGELAGELETDGRRLAATLAGVRFEGADLDALAPVGPAARPGRFRISGGSLCECRLRFALPIAMLADDRETAAMLGIDLELGAPRATGGLDREAVALELIAGEHRALSSGASGWFEDEILELQRALPDLHWKTCFGCGLSDYSPYGHGLFGGLMCFRDAASAYRAVKTKQLLLAIHDAFTEHVQETHVCPAWERRTPGAGYRG